MSSKSRPTDDQTSTNVCRNYVIFHVILLYCLAGTLVIATVIIDFTDREKQAQIVQELQQLRVRCNDAFIANSQSSWRQQAIAFSDEIASSVTKAPTYVNDYVSHGGSRRQEKIRKRRDSKSSDDSSFSSEPSVLADIDTENGMSEETSSTGSPNSNYTLTESVLKEVCLTVWEICPTVSGSQERGLPGPPGLPGLGIPGQKGEPGEKGHTGSTGAQGLPGALGIKGDKGDLGAVGQTGTPGLKGDQGAPGTAGLPGLPGVPGENGTKGEKGNPGRPTTMQLPDKTKIDTGCCDYILNDTLLRSLKGDKGDQGEKGQPGERGIAGSQGAIGEKGDKGDRGERGLPGVEGPAGINGTEGQRGKRGRPGQKGEIGTTGAKGKQGDKGEKGDSGLGEKGEKGAMGPPGLTLRPDGSPGIYAGMRGLPGPPGHPGAKGNKGEPGYSCGCTEVTTAETTTEITTTPEPTIEPRAVDCRIRSISKPMFQNSTKTHFGMWLKDSALSSPFKGRIWMTKHFTGKWLLSYDSIDLLRLDQPAAIYELKELYFGTGNVVYNGAFYYHRAGYNEIVKYDLLRNETVAKVTMDRAAFQSKDYVYSTEYNYFDLSVEENGLWVIYTHESEFDFLRVSKLNMEDLSVMKTWKIPMAQPRTFGNGWVTCGVLYLVRDVISDLTTIDFAYDLYTKQEVNVNFRFQNPNHMNNMIAYNHHEKMLYSWDRGYLLTYPVVL